MRVRGIWMVLLSVTSVQFGAAVAKSSFDRVDAVTLVWLRLALAAVVLLAVARPRLRGRSGRDWLVAAAYGVALASMNLALYQAISRIPLGAAVTIEFLGPLTVAILGSRRVREFAWVALAGLGVLLLGAGSLRLTPVGALFAALAAVAWGSYILLSQRTGARWPGVSGLAIGTAVGTLFTTPFLLAAGPGDLARGASWGFGAAVALLSTVVPYSLEMVALRSIPPAVFGILMSLEPAAAAVAGMVVIGEFLGGLEWLALVCVTVASVGTVRTGRGRDTDAVVVPPSPG